MTDVPVLFVRLLFPADDELLGRLRRDGWIVLRVWECRMGATAEWRITAAVTGST